MALPAHNQPLTESPAATMSPETFKQLRDLIYEQTGIHFKENKKYLLESRLQPRLLRIGCKSFDEYYRHLKTDPCRDREITALYASVTTNETFFYRDDAQLDTFMKVIVPSVLERNKDTRQVRIWSAACSTGDEPYTLALLLTQHAPLANWTIDILGTDISEPALEVARKGIYEAHALRKVPPHVAQKYFTGGPDRYTLAPSIMRCVRFMNVNLYDRPRLKLIRGLDIVFCRNCLIYFDEKAKHQIVNDLVDAMSPQGFLVIGFSESLHHVGDKLKTMHAGRSVVYQKR